MTLVERALAAARVGLGGVVGLLAASTLACPARRDAPSNPGASSNTTSTTANTQKPITGSIAAPLPSDLPGLTDSQMLAALPAGVALPEDVSASDADAWGIELEWSVRLRTTGEAAGDPAVAPVANALVTTEPWRALLSDGHVSMKIGSPAFVDDRSELRASVGFIGALHVWGTQASARYRVLPPGSLRAFLDEGRADVVPLAPARLVASEAGSRLGRKTERATITTSYGTIELEQIVAPSSVRPTLAADARPPGDAGATALSLAGAGNPLCRLLLELVAANRAASGEPCRADRVPVFAEVAYSTGGGLRLEVTSLRERTVPRWEITFPPAGAPLSATLSPLPAARLLVAADALLAVHPRGEVSQLVLQNDAGSPRIAIIDGIAVAVLPRGGSWSLDVRAGTYLLEWRTPIGELVERALEVAAPGHAAAAQLSPTLPEIAAAIPSARIGP